jgi:CDGSH-type Zn-finger protein
MARLIQSDHTGPVEVKVGGESKWICMCGLSKTKPMCDGSHRACSGEEQGKLYRYENGKRIEVAKP